MNTKLKFLCLAVALTIVTTVFAQDTLRLTIPQAEAMFLQKNLQLLAAKYNIDAQRALIIQAKAYPNPYFNIGCGIYDYANGKYFDFFASQGTAVTSSTAISASISQLILIAGKRNDNIAIAKTNTVLAEDQFADLLRTLKFTLRSDLISIYYWQQSAKVYNEELDGLKRVVAADTIQLQHGFIPKTQFVLDQAQLYSLQSEYNDLVNNINDNETEVRTFLDSIGSNNYIIPIIDTAVVHHIDPMKYPLTTLLDSAYSNRTDLRIARDNVTLGVQNLKLQRAMAVPDLTFNFGYQEDGEGWHNFNFPGVGFDLPLYDQNRGNIKSAKANIKSNDATLGFTHKTVEENVFRALQLATDDHKLYEGLDKSYPAQFDSLAKETLNQYLKRNIDMITFLTFYDAYKTNTVQLNYILANMVNAYANIDYMTGSDFFLK